MVHTFTSNAWIAGEEGGGNLINQHSFQRTCLINTYFFCTRQRVFLYTFFGTALASRLNKFKSTKFIIYLGNQHIFYCRCFLSRILPLRQNESCETICMIVFFTCMFIFMSIKFIFNEKVSHEDSL